MATVIVYDHKKTLLTHAEYEYNAIGEMLRAVDAEGNILSIEYDLLGRRTAMQSPDLGRKEYSYNSLGNLSWESDSELRSRGSDIHYRYDPERRWLLGIETRNRRGQNYQDITYALDAAGSLKKYAN